jgi:2,3-bisphosphoglycerate-independent phosphoglycerate mutase
MNKAALIILDGWGIGDGGPADAISQANTPTFDRLMANNPHSTLKTFGEHVGLPMGQMGNSEVGHLNIGAGRIVYQDLAKINLAVETGKLSENETLQEAFSHVIYTKGRLHLMGLVSHGGVHSSQHHLHAIIEQAELAGCESVFVHAFTDGRDTKPNSAIQNIIELQDFLIGRKARLVSMIGRYYAMDRDKRWERTKIAYDLLVHGVGSLVSSFEDECEKNYAAGVTDEFFEASLVEDQNSRIQSGDTVICFNFRTDRCRQITEVLTQRDVPEMDMHTVPLHYVTMTRYDESFKGVHVMYDKDNLKNTLGEIIASVKKTQLRIAETEKYPHVTFFFSGGREAIFDGEIREMAASPKVATYDLRPEMSADEVAGKCIKQIRSVKPDFICLNFANPDMVGHTGVFNAIVKAVEKVDAVLDEVLDELLTHGYKSIVIADHGNADLTQLPDGSPHTAHTTNPVPCLLVGSDRDLNDGILADVAPTILELMGITQPPEMTGKSLLE